FQMTEEMEDNEAEENLKLAKDVIRKRIEAIQRRRLRHEGSTIPVGRPRKWKNLNVNDQASPPPVVEETSLSTVSTKASDQTIESTFEIMERPTTTLSPLHNEPPATPLTRHTSIPSPLSNIGNQTTDLL